MGVQRSNVLHHVYPPSVGRASIQHLVPNVQKGDHMRWPTPYFPKTDYHAAGRRLDLARQILFWSIFHRLRTSLAPCAGRLIDRLGMEFGARDSAAYPVALGPRRRLRSSHVRGLDKGKKRTDERTRTADLESHYECAGRRCWGVHSLANAAFIEDFLCCGLQCIAPYCARGGIRMVSEWYQSAIGLQDNTPITATITEGRYLHRLRLLQETLAFDLLTFTMAREDVLPI